MRCYRFRWLILTALLLVTLWQTVACRHSSVPGSQVACHPVRHAAGTTCVPDNIKRLVTLDIAAFEHAIALGLKPVGTVSSEAYSSNLQHKLIGIETIGHANAPNLERILALKPDLILGMSFHRSLYAQASQIAPTVLIQSNYIGQWEKTFQTLSVALGRERIAQQVMNHYHDRLQDFKDRLKQKIANVDQPLPFPPKVSIVRVYQNNINLHLRDSFGGKVLQDAGLARPVAQDIDAATARNLFDNQIQASISLEAIDRADGDVIFIWTAGSTAQVNQSSQENLAKLQSNPLWRQLKAVQSNQVYFVSNSWAGNGAIAANAVIDDLFKYLIKEP
jgi:iron complex transport system substrate-binding protein